MSAILSADDLNDFISPGVACIKPVEKLPANAQDLSDLDASSTQKSPPPAQISLTDCLACSGCVTSAEAVLVSLQSHAEVLSALDREPGIRLLSNGKLADPSGPDGNGLIYVASVSPQTRASIAATFNTSEHDAAHMIQQLLSGPQGIKNRGVYRNSFQWVVDTNVAREACLVLGTQEVLDPRSQDGGTMNVKKPILTSACPGWVCYAEKTHPHVLPHLTRLKSPQALMGTLMKSVLSRRLGVEPERIWHVAIMPCFDKKLEASREELTDATWNNSGKQNVRDVDCVITSKELLMLAQSRGVDFAKLPRTPIPHDLQVQFPDSRFHEYLFPPRRRKGIAVNPMTGTSGGYLHHVLQQAVARFPGSSIHTSRGRNADVSEYSIVSESGEIMLTAARYYGFRNIQNLVRRLKPTTGTRMPGGRPITAMKKSTMRPSGLEYAYVEVMACPGGCTNGGGQIKLDDPIVRSQALNIVEAGPQEQKAWLAQVDEAYFSGDEINSEGSTDLSGFDTTDSERVQDMLEHWVSTTGIALSKLAYTSYHAVISEVGKRVTDTERAIEIAGKIGGGW